MTGLLHSPRKRSIREVKGNSFLRCKNQSAAKKGSRKSHEPRLGGVRRDSLGKPNAP